MKTHLFAVRQHKNARQTIFLPGVFYYRAPWKMRTTKLLFAVRPKICARQRLKRMAIIVFPVVHVQSPCRPLTRQIKGVAKQMAESESFYHRGRAW
jgi:hypothetical protein